MKIVIVGAGKVGVALTRHLAVENRVTVIDQNPHLVENIINIYDVMGVCGNGASYDVQKEADVEQADLLIATTSSDEINILTCLVAKKMGVQHTIARMRSPEYGRQLRFMRSELGLSMAINPEAATAREIARVLRFPTAMKLESFSKGRLELVEYRVAEHTALDGTRLSELYRNFKVRVLICAVRRGEQAFIPDGNFILHGGDKISLTASPAEIQKLLKRLGVLRKQARDVMILGGSRTAFYLAKMLSNTGNNVKIIDQNRARCRNLCEALPNAVIINGDGSQQELLLEEGLRSMDAFVALTGIDEENILMSLFAASQNVPNCELVDRNNHI